MAHGIAGRAVALTVEDVGATATLDGVVAVSAQDRVLAQGSGRDIRCPASSQGLES